MTVATRWLDHMRTLREYARALELQKRELEAQAPRFPPERAPLARLMEDGALWIDRDGIPAAQLAGFVAWIGQVFGP